MGLRDFFIDKVNRVSLEQKREVKDSLWIKCDNCNEIIYKEEVEKNMKICPSCGYHFKITAMERINYIIDSNSFEELDSNLVSVDPLKFRDSKKYIDRIKIAQKKTGLNDAYISGRASINSIPVNIGSIEFNFMGGSMGSVVGEKIARLIDDAIIHKRHVITISASGGARMQESMLSLMQMAKTATSLSKLSSSGLGHISILTHPTTGGVTASYAMLGDINIAEPGALIGFAGSRVIEQTIKQTLPEGFQKSEYLLTHGMIDNIVSRLNLKKTLTHYLRFFG